MEEASKISSWINNRLGNGDYSFSIGTIKAEMPNKTAISIKRSLDRLTAQKKIMSIHKGFFIIIPPTYQNMGVLPPIMFIDDLMNYLNRPYYLSLISAAALHGAAHQQPQSHYICTNMPSLRATRKSGININYISKCNLKNNFIDKKKTESGYINVSNPLLTCIDLLNYNKTIGGLNRASTIINELSDEINIDNLNSKIFDLASNADLQRLGFLWECHTAQQDLANQLFTLLEKHLKRIRSYKLTNSKPAIKDNFKNRWNINVNTIIEIDE